MGLFSSWKRSAKKSRLMKRAAERVRSMDMTGAIDEIYEYLRSDDVFNEVLTQFDATSKDIEAIVVGLMASGAGGTYRGHFVPVSAVLFPDTLAYLLRSQRGTVKKAEAYFQVEDYFRQGHIIFEPERAYK